MSSGPGFGGSALPPCTTACGCRPAPRSMRRQSYWNELGVATATVMVSRLAWVTEGGDPLRAWDIDALRAR